MVFDKVTTKSRLSLIVQVNVFLNRTVAVDSDWRFDNLCVSHLLRVKRWRWLSHRLSKRQSLSTTTVLFRTTFTRMTKLNLLLKWLLGSNLSQSYNPQCSLYEQHLKIFGTGIIFDSDLGKIRVVIKSRGPGIFRGY